MAHIGLIACASKKLDSAAPARDIYVSDLFRKARDYVETHCARWFVLSAKHGLLFPGTLIEPYDETLNDKNANEREVWSRNVWDALRHEVQAGDTVFVLAGLSYREHLVPVLEAHGCTVHVPLEGLRIGAQLKWLNEHADLAAGSPALAKFYGLMARLEEALAGKRLLAECTGNMEWPQRGVYFFFEQGEMRRDGTTPRIVRVGTHAVGSGAKSKLWQRLRTHKGTDAGLGNHRGSIFRLHVGNALAARDPSLVVPTWGRGQSASTEIREGEKSLERAVSSYLGTMMILWLAIEDEPGPSSDRAFLERSLIGILAQEGRRIDVPSETWLGRHSTEKRIRDTGLWNLNHLYETSNDACLDVLEKYVAVAAGEQSPPSGPLAPTGWRG